MSESSEKHIEVGRKSLHSRHRWLVRWQRGGFWVDLLIVVLVGIIVEWINLIILLGVDPGGGPEWMFGVRLEMVNR